MVIVRWVVLAVVFMVASNYIPGIQVGGFWSAFIAAIVLSMVNFFIKPVVIIFTLPVNILTLGLFTFVINALMICLVAALMGSFSVTFWGAFFLAIVIMVVKSVLSFVGC